MSSVSVAMATWNGEQHLREQLESIGRQTLLPCELVVSDDASTDATIEIIEQFARTAPFPVRVHAGQDRIGVGENFMRAAQRCSGDLIAFSDQDDVWLPEKLERCAASLGLPEVVLAIHACSVVDETLRPLGEIVPTIARDRISSPLEPPRWGEAPGMGMVFSLDLLSLLEWDSRPVAHHAHGRLLHDEWIYGIARVAGSIAFLAEPHCLYRQHSANIEGAPERGAGAWMRSATTTGGVYYGRRAEQARQWAALLAGAAEQRAPEEELAARLRGEARSYERLADALEQRVLVYEAGQSRGRRLRAVARALGSGTYRSRRREGFGLRGLARDTTMIVGGRTGSAR